jgi:hypothetical protein
MLVGIHSPTNPEEIGTMNTSISTSRTITVKAVLAAVAMSAGALVPAVAGAGPVEDAEQRCLADASGSADSLERWADHCHGIAGEHREAYHDCMRNAPGTADSLERWVDHCTEAAGGADNG